MCLMAQVSLSSQLKERLKEIKNEDDHTSLDSVVRTLLERSQLVEGYQTLIKQNTSPTISDTTPLTSELQPDSNIDGVITNKVMTVVEQLPLESKSCHYYC
jgi:hypothetical protein